MTIPSNVLVFSQDKFVSFPPCKCNRDSNRNSMFAFSAGTTTKQCQGFGDFTVYSTSVMGGRDVRVFNCNSLSE